MPDSELRILPDLGQLVFEDKHVGARKAILQQTDEVQVNVYVLEPGGLIPAHRHSRSWDVSVVFEGRLQARFVEHGQVRTVVCERGGAAVIPPDTVHEVSNPSPADRLVFLLIQSPSSQFDFLKEVLPAVSRRPAAPAVRRGPGVPPKR